MSRPALPAVAAAGAAGLAAWAASGALANDRPARLGAMQAGGQVRLVSAAAGTAVLTADHLLPGEAVGGTVRLANTGDVAGLLELDATGVQDTPGTGGGRLSAALLVRVDDVTAVPAVTVFSGPLTSLEGAPLGRLGAGAARTYRVTATLPDSGPFGADNALQGSSTRLDLTWHAEPLAPAATPTPAATPAATPAPQPVVLPPPPAAAASVLTLRIPWQRVLLTRGITVSGSCDRRCRLSFGAVIETAPRGGSVGRVVMRRKVFRLAGSRRVLAPGAERRIRLRLTPRAVLRMRALLLTRGRVAVRIDARVRSALGAATVQRRIVIVTSRRAARHRAAQGH